MPDLGQDSSLSERVLFEFPSKGNIFVGLSYCFSKARLNFLTIPDCIVQRGVMFESHQGNIALVRNSNGTLSFEYLIWPGAVLCWMVFVLNFSRRNRACRTGTRTVEPGIHRPKQKNFNNLGPARTRTAKNFQISDRTRTNKILKISDRFEPVIRGSLGWAIPYTLLAKWSLILSW